MIIILYNYILTYICIRICVDKDVMLVNKVAEEYWGQKIGYGKCLLSEQWLT